MAGHEHNIRRASRKDFQSHTITIEADLIDAGDPVTFSYTTQTLVRTDSPCLFFDIEQPTRNLKVNPEHIDTNIHTISTIDLIPNATPTRIEHSPNTIPSRTIRIESDNWIFPGSGLAFIWRHSIQAASDAPRRQRCCALDHE